MFWLLKLQEDIQNTSCLIFFSQMLALKKNLVLFCVKSWIFSSFYCCLKWLFFSRILVIPCDCIYPFVIFSASLISWRQFSLGVFKSNVKKKLKWLGPGTTWFAMWTLGGRHNPPPPPNETEKNALLNTTSNTVESLVTWLYIAFRSFCYKRETAESVLNSVSPAVRKSAGLF